MLQSYNTKQSYPEEISSIYKETKIIINKILDQSTLQLLRRASHYIDEDSGNVTIQESDNFQDFYLWGNLANNPRLRNVEFGKEEDIASHVSFNLLKGMHEKKLAVRVVRRNYDNLVEEVEGETNQAENVEDVWDDLTPIPSEVDETEENLENLDENAPVQENAEENNASGEAATAEIEQSEEKPSEEENEPVQPAEETLESITEEFKYPVDYFSMNDYNQTF